MGAIFGALYLAISRRPLQAVFSLQALSLALLSFAEFMLARQASAGAAVEWHRLLYVGQVAAVVFFLHFVSLLVQAPLRLGVLTICYTFGLAAGVLCHTRVFDPGYHTILVQARRGVLQAADETSLLYAALSAAVIFVLIFAWQRLLRGLRRAQAAEFAPLVHEASLILIGSLTVIVLSGVDVAFYISGLEAAPRLHSVGIILWSVLSSVAVAKEFWRAEADKRRLTEILEARDQAVSDVAHELQSPLTVIQGFASTLLRVSADKLDEEARARFLRIILDETRRLTRLIRNMLDTTRLEAGKAAVLRLEEVALAPLLQEVTERMQASTTIHRLVLEVPENLPPLIADQDKLHQILSNLLGNAIKYSPEGGNVLIRAEVNEAEIAVSVTDHGLGMTREQQQRLFERLSRVVDPSRKIGGTGIGLHLIKGLVEAHTGRIEVESEPGVGSTFRFTIPRSLTKPEAEKPLARLVPQ